MNFQNPDNALLRDKKLFIFDMDGTIYLGGRVFPFAVDFIRRLRAAGKRVRHAGKRDVLRPKERRQL